MHSQPEIIHFINGVNTCFIISEKNEHGTRCAGEIAAVANSICGVGVAYRANISGVRVLSGRMTDSMEAAAFIQGLEVNDIFSCR